MRHRLIHYDWLPQELSAPPEAAPDSRYRGVRRALPVAIRKELTERQRQCLEKRLQGEAVKDIAADLGISPPTVSVHLRKGIQRLRHVLQYSLYLPNEQE